MSRLKVQQKSQGDVNQVLSIRAHTVLEERSNQASVGLQWAYRAFKGTPRRVFLISLATLIRRLVRSKLDGVMLGIMRKHQTNRLITMIET